MRWDEQNFTSVEYVETAGEFAAWPSAAFCDGVDFSVSATEKVYDLAGIGINLAADANSVVFEDSHIKITYQDTKLYPMGMIIPDRANCDADVNFVVLWFGVRLRFLVG